MYGGKCTTMSMLVSSSWPAQAGLQPALTETLLDFGASTEPRGEGNWQSPAHTALIFGFTGAAEVLVKRGAKVDLMVAAGLGRVDDARRMLAESSERDRHMAMMLASQLGNVEVVRLLLDAGEDPDRYNPEGGHKHCTPIHQAAIAGHMPVVQLLAERGAKLDQKDKIYKSTPLGWAKYGGQSATADYLQSRGAAAQAG
jgi:ankyrin repeat protein